MHVVGHDLHRLDSDIELCRLLIQEFLQPLVDSINEYRPPVLGTPDEMIGYVIYTMPAFRVSSGCV